MEKKVKFIETRNDFRGNYGAFKNNTQLQVVGYQRLSKSKARKKKISDQRAITIYLLDCSLSDAIIKDRKALQRKKRAMYYKSIHNKVRSKDDNSVEAIV